MQHGQFTQLEQAEQARDQLVREFMHHPEISLIDIGYDPQAMTAKDQIVLRVHASGPVTSEQLGLPEEVGGFRVVLLSGTYRLE